MLANIQLLLNAHNPLPLMLVAIAYFVCIYAVFTYAAWILSKIVNRPIEAKQINPHQIRTEYLNSLRSILLFGLGIIIPWGFLQIGVTHVNANSSVILVALEFAILIVWNDIHFFIIHFLLHKKFRKLHTTHHRSVAATPFAAYSMSVAEALLLGSVMPIAMLFHSFSIASLLLLPIWSIL